MKASEIRPCDNCGGILGHFFYTADISQILVDVRPLQERQGLMMMWGGNPAMAPIADVLASTSLDDVGVRLADKDPSLGTRLILCFDCYVKIGLASLVEKITEAGEDSPP